MLKFLNSFCLEFVYPIGTVDLTIIEPLKLIRSNVDKFSSMVEVSKEPVFSTKFVGVQITTKSESIASFSSSFVRLMLCNR